MAAITGRKSGSSEARQPVESPDSIRSVARAKMLLALGEGEWQGGIDGTQILLDGTPAIAADGTENFPGFKWEFRPGTQYQDHIAGLPSVENEISVGVELRSSTPYVRSITNTELSAARVRLSWPSLQERKDNGDVVGYRIDYAIDVATDGGAWAELLTATINDKTTTKYERSHRIDLPASTSGWTLRVRRLTANKDNSNTIADVMRVEAVTEVIDAKLRYPNTALLYVEFDASQFQNIPKIACRAKMRIVRVPNNYDPQSRSYSGLWDGTFKWAWTDNPAWVFYDIVLSKRFGMGRRLDASMVDRWELYQIAQYCDELVSDGKGGMEPRFTCNIYIQSQADAWTVLRDVAAIFRGVSYWSGSQLIAHADMPSDIEYVFSRSNVVDGKFRYGGQSEKTNYSSALVSWDNPANGYQSEPEAVSIPSLVRRFGYNQTEITAVGCTRQSEANRRGRWLLLTNNVDRSVTFKTGLEGYLPTPGRIIGVADALLAGRQLAGRIGLVSGRQVTVDREAPIKVGDRLIVNLPSGKAEARTVQSVAGRVVTVTANFSEAPKAQAQWGVESSDLVIQQYRITGITRADGGFEISAVMTDPGKHGQVDSGTRLESRPISVIPAGTQQAPTRVTLSTYTRIEQGMAVTTLRAQWEAAAGAVAYTAEWRKDSGEWISVPRTSGLGFEVPGIYTGRYMVRVRAVNALDVSSLPAYSAETELTGKAGAPPALASLAATSKVFGIALNWTFPPRAEDTQRTEIWYGSENDLSAATKLSDLAYPQSDYEMQGLAAGVRFFFWGRLVDRTGNIGPFYPVLNGVVGQSSSDATPILEYLTGKITESEFGKHLLDRINLIDGTGPGSVNDRLGDLKADIGDLVDALEYEPAKAYAAGETVRQGQRLYTAKVAVPTGEANAPPNANYWLDTGQIVQAANGLAAQVHKNATDISTVDDKTTANAEQLSGVKSAINDPATGLAANANGISSLKSTVDKQGSDLTATAQRVDGLTAQITPDLTGDDGWNVGEDTVYAGTVTVQSVTVNATNAVAQRIDSINASIGQTNAALSSEQTARVSADNALSTRVDTAQATANGATAAVQQTSSALANTNGKLAAIWSVRMELAQNGEYYSTGFGLGLEAGAGGARSRFAVRADDFLVMNTNTQSPQTFFAVSGGQTFIQAAYIQDGTITNAKIGSYISSTNYIAGQSGWILNKNGTLEINGMVAGGGRLVITNRSVRVYDANNVKRVQLGDLTE